MTPRSGQCVLAFMFTTLLGASASGGDCSTAVSHADAEGGAMPYSLAFDQPQLPPAGAFEISSDGRWAAYVVERRADTPAAVRGGTPGLPLASRSLHVADLRDHGSVEACPDSVGPWAPSWSPNNELLAFYADGEGGARLWVYDLAKRTCRQASAAAIKRRPYGHVGNEPQWSADGKTVFVPLMPEADEKVEQAAPAMDAAKVAVYRSGREDKEAGEAAGVDARAGTLSATIGAIDIATGEARILVRADDVPRPQLLRVSPTGRWVSYFSVPRQKDPTSQVMTVDLAVVPAAGGKAQVIAQELIQLSVLTFPSLGYSWHPREDRLVYMKDNRLWLVDFAAGAPVTPRQLAPELGELEPALNWFTRDGRFVVVGTEPVFNEGRGAMGVPRGLALVPLDRGAAQRFSFDTERYSYADILKADTSTVWQPDGKSVTLRLREKRTGKSAIVRVDPATSKARILWQGLAQIGGRAPATPGARDLGAWTAGGNHHFIAGTFEDYATPQDIYRYSADFSARERISHVDPRLDELTTGTVEFFETTVPMYDGSLEKVRTAVLLPPGAKRGDRLPAVVLVYPGADLSLAAERFGGGTAGGVESALLYTSRGYAVLLADLKLGPVGKAGNPIQEMTDSLLPQIYHAAALGYVDIARLALRGQSFGGYATAAIVSQTHLFRAAVPSSGFYDIPGHYGRLSNGRSSYVAYFESAQGRMGGPLWSNPQRYIDNSPYYRADRIFTPLLIVQGGDDPHVDEAGKLFAALQRLGKSVELAIYPGEGHAVPGWSVGHAVDASRRIVQFYAEHGVTTRTTCQDGSVSGSTQP